MPVATMLAIAASFWSAHGYAATADVDWSWDMSFPAMHAGAAFVYRDGLGGRSYRIELNRYGWDQDSNLQRCVIVIHEMGHAEFDFDHEPGTVMAADASIYSSNVPGTCIRSKRAWKALADA